MKRQIFISISLLLATSLSSCYSYFDEPNEKGLNQTKSCIDYYEELVNIYTTDPEITVDTINTKSIDLIDQHPLLSIESENLNIDTNCLCRGLRNYGQTTVVEVNYFGRKSSYEYKVGDPLKERHIVIVGNENDFDIDQILQFEGEHVIFEENLGQHSKLIVTHFEM
ncbi:MAG: hypothetical protein H6582_03625 [Crocinitomicaceae bacterium]|nr:hypothetical protein [Crocinitomicaceae bacterium]